MSAGTQQVDAVKAGTPVRIHTKGQTGIFSTGIVASEWVHDNVVYEQTDDGDLSPEDVKALLLEKENRRRMKLEKAHALMAMREQLETRARRQPIPQEVKVAVWQRDGGRCVECGGQAELEYDHVIPLAMGGSDTERNLQLLCAVCNRRKGATLG